MQHIPLSDVAHRLVREVACTQCYQRPPGSELLGPEAPRACEGRCPLFVHLPTLIGLAGRVDDAPGSCDLAVRDRVCGGCRLGPTAGDSCAEYAARTCPLSRHGGDVLAALRRAARFASHPAEPQPS